MVSNMMYMDGGEGGENVVKDRSAGRYNLREAFLAEPSMIYRYRYTYKVTAAYMYNVHYLLYEYEQGGSGCFQ